MNLLRTGNFFGETNRTIRLDGITLTDTEYTHPYVDWHFHENAYFTFILQGKLIEGNRRETYHCTNGGLLFHSWEEPHYNIKPAGYTRGFHIEMIPACLPDFSFERQGMEGSFEIENPDIKFLLYRIFRETKIYDDASPVSIQMLLAEVFGRMSRAKETAQRSKPLWAQKLKEILIDGFCGENLSLANLANELNIHPVHLSRAFFKHFDCTFGEYVRKLRIEKSLALLPNKNLSLTDIAYLCGFADQSHFLRSFKKINGISPSHYRKIL